jgi:hypothetical protein
MQVWSEMYRLSTFGKLGKKKLCPITEDKKLQNICISFKKSRELKLGCSDMPPGLQVGRFENSEIFKNKA